MAAIYMWLPPGDLIVTTPLYPVEVSEEFEMSLEMLGVFEFPFPTDSYTWISYDASADLEDINLQADPVEDSYEWISYGFTGAQIHDIHLIADPVEDSYVWISYGMVGADLEDRLITALIPDDENEFQMGLDILELTIETDE